MEAVTDFIFLSSRMTMDSDCSHEIKILAWRKDSYDKVRVLENSRHHFAVTKVCIVKTMVFLVVMYGCESWTIKKAKHRRIDAFKLWFLRPCSDSSATPSFPSQPEGKIVLPRANPRGRLRSPS